MIKCLPGCMPLWRKSLHEKNGYFNSAVNTMVIITDSIEELGLSVSENEIGLVRSQIFYDITGKVEQVD